MFYGTGLNWYNVDYKNATIHAEVDALNKIKYSRKTKKIIIIVYRINNAGTKYLMSKPCDNCMKSIKETLEKKNYKLHRGYYTDNNSQFIRFTI